MTCSRLPVIVLAVCSLAGAASAQELPKAPIVPAEVPPGIETTQPGVKLTLLAEHPDLVTPTGIDVDDDGNIWLISSHTHHRPQGYVGPVHDEVLVFDRTGKKRRVFYNKTDATMHLKVGHDGWVYLAERDRILRVRDGDGDGVGDVEENVAVLDSVSVYPHNGLSGMAWYPVVDMATSTVTIELLFSLGENFGKDWTLSGNDGAKVSGRGEGGIFRCRPDGTGLQRIARGFWNPFGLMVRDDFEIFAVDNDPGSRPPCRLLQIVPGGDYGYQWVYGSAPVHPFVAWNGELRGTLPMIHPTGEGPCAIVPLGGGVMVPSWSNHRIDYFPLVREGAGYTSKRVELLHGTDFFRPVDMAEGKDGAFYLTDWVFSSYELHGRGRLWKLEIDREKAGWMQKKVEPRNEAARFAEELRAGTAKVERPKLMELVRSSDRILADAALAALARECASWTPDRLRALSVQDRVWALVALRRNDLGETKWVRALWDDSDPEVRFECLRWIADGVLTDFTADVEKLLTRADLDYRLFEAALATRNTLRGNPGAGVTDVPLLVERLTDPAAPARLKGFALRLVPPGHAKVTVAMLREFAHDADPGLAAEAVRSLVARGTAETQVVLAEVAADENREAQLRADAIPGLAASEMPEHRALLVKLVAHGNATVRNEAMRSLRVVALSGEERVAVEEAVRKYPESADLAQTLLDPAKLFATRPPMNDTDGWLQRIETLPGQADPAIGRRIFFHPRLATCGSCHRHSGRGAVVGPDLSLVARQGDTKAILQSILEPSREVAPQFFPTLLELADGTSFTGILLRSSSIDVFRDLTGRERVFKKSDVVRWTELQTSIMPPGLVAMLTDSELRDLLAFLRSGAP